MPHENDRCPLDGWRRAQFTEYGVTYSRCPFCGQCEETPCT